MWTGTSIKLWNVISSVIEPQQQGESFDNYFILLRELAKTSVYAKSIREQIIEGLQDGDTVEDLLQESKLTLAITATKCRSKEAAKNNRLQIAVQEQDMEMVAAVHNPQLRAPQRKYHTCPAHNIRIAAFTAQHMTESIHVATRWVILPEFAGAKRGHTSKHHSVMAPNLQSMRFTCSHPRVITYSCITLQETGKKQHPPFTVQMTSSTRTSPVTALPDSGADISAARQVIIGILRYHLDNLALSEISPKAVNRACMKQVEKYQLSLVYKVGHIEMTSTFFPGVSGALISWKAAKEMGILPPQYPYPERILQVDQYPKVKSTKAIGNYNSTAHRGISISIQ